MRILITGGGGFLGAVLTRHLLRTTLHTLTILDRFDWGVQPLLSVLASSDGARVEIIRGDVRDLATVHQAVHRAAEPANLIVHLAGIVGYPACDADPQDADSTNVHGTAHVCATHLPVIFASTGSCYGKVEGEATEATPLSPLTRYGRNKADAEAIVLAAGGTVLRLATLFGLSPRMRWDLLPNDFARRGVAGEIHLYEPDARRTFLHVDDAAMAFRLAIEGRLAHGVWNVGSPAMNWSKRQLAEEIQALTSCRIGEQAGRDPDQRDYAVNYDKIQAVGFHPQIDLAATLPQLVALARVWA
jgi:nucleoside-diphosphate-sugar epimerase